ncbi:MAG: tripartite tricarboxylate transporter permease [Deltaproteobacteria bacterium]|nr:tripartite tricarboxylate transporter permease [Deltaproteobacteria bacterium]
MDFFGSILYGFQVTFQPINFLFCGVGVLVGTLVGVLPGIGPAGAMALLLPATFKFSPTSTIILLAGIYYGVQYGGSTTSILVRIPGEASSVMTCIDGHQMARQGRAGPALGIAAWGSFIAGTIANIGLMLVAIPLAHAALKLGPPEYFALMCTGLIIVTYLAQGSVLKAVMMGLVGILLGSIGLDLISGFPRFTFGINELTDGVGIVPLVMGLFGISEILENLEGSLEREVFKTRIKNLWPSLKDWMEAKWAIVRGSVIGFLLGVLPGGGAVISTFVSYAVEKKISKHPEKFGKGAIEGVAGPESANNAAAGSSLIPLLSLGIPPNPIMAIFFSALIIHGIQPGPLLIRQHPDLFWGLVASLYLGNGLLLVLNLPLIGIWIKVLEIPYKILFPMILLFCIIGVYSMNNLSFDLYVMLFFGVVGWLMRKFGYEGAPLILAFVLGPMLENALRQSLLISQGSFLIFVTRPISAIALGLAFLLLLTTFLPHFKKRRQQYDQFKE